jgi:hypothetical protein
VSSEKLSFLARFEEKWKFEEIGIFLRKNILQESRWIEKVNFCVFWIFGIFDAELLGAGQRNFGLPIIIFYTLPAVWGGENPSG